MSNLYVPSSLRRPTPAKTRVLREAMMVLLNEVFPGCQFRETSIKDTYSRVPTWYVCSICTESVAPEQPWWMFLKQKQLISQIVHVEVKMKHINSDGVPFELDIKTQTTENKYRMILETLYKAIEAGNQEASRAQ